MAWAFVQKNISVNTGASSTISVTVSAISSGDLCWCAVTSDNGSTTCTVKDSGGNSYTAIDTFNDAGNSTMLYTFYIKNSPAGATSVTASYGGAVSFRGIVFQEWSGGDTAAPLDVHNIGTATGSAVASPSITPTVDGDLILGVVVPDSGGATPSASGPYTLRNSATPPDFADESQVQVTAAATTATFTLSPAQTAILGVAAFKLATAAASVTPVFFAVADPPRTVRAIGY